MPDRHPSQFSLPVTPTLVGATFGIGLFLLASHASAHRSGCHRWHSCPSDTGSYVCGDLGYNTYCPENTTAAPAQTTTAPPRQPASTPSDSIRLTPPATPVPKSSASQASGAPKFTQWYFTNCTDAKTGAVSTTLVTGRAMNCQFVIETLPNGARPVRAEFSYELEYPQGGATRKLALTSTDVWTMGGTSPIKHRVDGSRLVFTVPLNVRERADRPYTALGVIGTVVFNNGASKRVYEPLPVRHGK